MTPDRSPRRKRAARGGAAVRIFGEGLQTRDFVYVKDIAEANRRALSAAATGACNVGTERTVTLLDLVAALERVGGRAVARQFERPAPSDIRDSATSTARLAHALGFIPKRRWKPV